MTQGSAPGALNLSSGRNSPEGRSAGARDAQRCCRGRQPLDPLREPQLQPASSAESFLAAAPQTPPTNT